MFFGMRGTNNTIRLLAAMVPSLAGQTLTRGGGWEDEMMMGI